MRELQGKKCPKSIFLVISYEGGHKKFFPKNLFRQ